MPVLPGAYGEKEDDTVKEFTTEMISQLNDANDALRGTPEYFKYLMDSDFKKTGGKWKFIGHGIPSRAGKFKTIKGTTYIVTECAEGQNRYIVTEAVKELLGI